MNTRDYSIRLMGLATLPMATQTMQSPSLYSREKNQLWVLSTRLKLTSCLARSVVTGRIETVNRLRRPTTTVSKRVCCSQDMIPTARSLPTVIMKHEECVLRSGCAQPLLSRKVARMPFGSTTPMGRGCGARYRTRCWRKYHKPRWLTIFTLL